MFLEERACGARAVAVAEGARRESGEGRFLFLEERACGARAVSVAEGVRQENGVGRFVSRGK